MKRRFTAPKESARCNGTVKYKDGSLARCMHRKEKGRDYCRQHGKGEPLLGK